MKLWPGDWEEKIHRMNKKVDEDNGRGETQEDGKFRKLRRFSRNELWKNIGCILSPPTFGLRGSIMWEKNQSPCHLVLETPQDPSHAGVNHPSICTKEQHRLDGGFKESFLIF